MTSAHEFSATAAFEKAQDIVLRAIATKRSAIDFHRLPGLEKLPDLDQIPWLTAIDAHQTKISNLRPIENLKRLKRLYVSFTEVKDLSPIAGLKSLRSLHVRGTSVSNISALSNLQELRSLGLSETLVSDISPIASLTKLIGGVKRDSRFGGLSFADCPIKDPRLIQYSRLGNPERTIRTIDYLRDLQGLPVFIFNDAAELELDDSDEDLVPLDGVPSPFAFALTAAGTISVVPNSANFPNLPSPTSQRDHEQRLEACRLIASDIVQALTGQNYQARNEYLAGLKRYLERLPNNPRTGNILLADAEARTLRSLFAVDADVLSAPFASSLKTFLEQHIGLRAFYPEISTFYRDVQDGRLNTPLPLDAVEGFIRGVREFTPRIFEPSVSIALEGTTEEAKIVPGEKEQPASADKNQPMPPPDPLGEIEPGKARDFSIASTMNSLWKAFQEGEKVNKFVSAWVSAGSKLWPYAQELLKWLHEFVSGGGPSAH